jgi:hypothetical protein
VCTLQDVPCATCTLSHHGGCCCCRRCCCRCCRLEAEAESVGFPLLVKAVSGGGGKGMKLATKRVSDTPAAVVPACKADFPCSLYNCSGLKVASASSWSQSG